MKKTTLVAAILLGSAAASSLLAQGTINWGNIFGTGFRAPIYGVDPTAPGVRKTGNSAAGLPAGPAVYGGALLAGTGFTMALYGGDSAAEAMSSLTPLGNGTSTFLTAAGAGFMNPRTVTDSQRPPGTTGVNLQVRAWDNQMGGVTSWAQVLARQGTVAGGESDVFTVAALGGGTITSPQTLGLRSFQLTQVPEPSLIALGALGLGALLLRRRKQ